MKEAQQPMQTWTSTTDWTGRAGPTECLDACISCSFVTATERFRTLVPWSEGYRRRSPWYLSEFMIIAEKRDWTAFLLHWSHWRYGNLTPWKSESSDVYSRPSIEEGHSTLLCNHSSRLAARLSSLMTCGWTFETSQGLASGYQRAWVEEEVLGRYYGDHERHSAA